jgi:hypothetical protein
MIRRDELNAMQQSLDELVADANSGRAHTDLGTIDGFQQQRNASAETGTEATVRWRVGLSSAAPRTLRVDVRMCVAELLAELLRENPHLRRRALRVATDQNESLPDDAPLSEIGLLPGGSACVVLVPDERPCACTPSVDATKRETEARAAAARASTADILGGELAKPNSAQAASTGRKGLTLLYRLRGSTRAAPRALQGGPQATVMDVLEEIAEKEAAVAIRLRTGERVELARGGEEEQEALPHSATLESLGFRPGGTFSVSVL